MMVVWYGQLTILIGCIDGQFQGIRDNDKGKRNSNGI
jgi:hypothetical protein